MSVNRLQLLPLFAALGGAELRRVAEWAREVTVAEGERLVGEQRHPYDFLVIEEGSAEVRRDGLRVAELGAGDFFGEVALLETGLRTATVVALTPMRLLALGGDEFRRLEAELPELARQVRAAAAERLPPG